MSDYIDLFYVIKVLQFYSGQKKKKINSIKKYKKHDFYVFLLCISAFNRYN